MMQLQLQLQKQVNNQYWPMPHPYWRSAIDREGREEEVERKFVRALSDPERADQRHAGLSAFLTGGVALTPHDSNTSGMSR